MTQPPETTAEESPTSPGSPIKEQDCIAAAILIDSTKPSYMDLAWARRALFAAGKRLKELESESAFFMSECSKYAGRLVDSQTTIDRLQAELAGCKSLLQQSGKYGDSIDSLIGTYISGRAHEMDSREALKQRAEHAEANLATLHAQAQAERERGERLTAAAKDVIDAYSDRFEVPPRGCIGPIDEPIAQLSLAITAYLSTQPSAPPASSEPAAPAPTTDQKAGM